MGYVFASGSAVFATAAILFYWLSVSRLKAKDPVQLRLMGSPGQLHDDTKLSSWMLFDYMVKCRFLYQGDAALVVYGTLWYLSTVLMFGLLIWEWAR
jgi:hypothetical protein